MSKKYRVGADIGGTFTDLIVVDSETGQFSIGKVLTTPDDPSRAVEEALLETLQSFGVRPDEVQHLIHGTTLVTNAMIERKGAKTALLTTQGFRDSIEIGRETRYDLYDLMLEQPKTLVPRYLRFDVPQRTLSDGSTYQELDTAYVEKLALELVEHRIEAVAIVFLHSFTNPAAEQAARGVLQKVAPSLRVSISSEVVPEIREFERASTTIANVYVEALVERYLRGLEQRLQSIGFEGNFYLMLSSGGIATVETTVRHPVRLLESGPAAGALAANAYGLATGHPDLISFDMGGTTAKICVIDQGRPLIAHQFEVDRIYRFKKGSGLPIKIPVIELIEIGTGGGSIARVDALGLLKVGPDSSGADPGPVCYGRGSSEPTVTDANLILGYLDPAYFLGGRMSLELEKARQVIQEKIATPLGLSVEEAAWGIHQIANENMANAARVHSLERGKDPRRFPLFAFGGAGPVHAYRIGLSLGSPLLLAPLGAGVMSTVGFLLAPLAFDFVRSWPVQLDAIDWERANSLLSEMEAEGHTLLTESGVASDQISHRREVDMRYVGQGHEIRVPIPNGRLRAQSMNKIQSKFETVYRALYERPGPPVRLEILNWRVVSSGPKADVHLQMKPSAGRRSPPAPLRPPSIPPNSGGEELGEGRPSPPAPLPILGEGRPSPPAPLPILGEGSHDVAQTVKGSRQAYFPEAGGFTSTPIYDRYLMKPGMVFNGPAIVEERESTAIVGPHSQCHIDEHHNLVVQMPIFDHESRGLRESLTTNQDAIAGANL